MALQLTKDSIDLGIITLDAAPMVKFYRDTLGLKPDGEMDMPGGSHMTRLTCGTTTVKIVVNGKKPPAEAAPAASASLLTGVTGAATGSTESNRLFLQA